MRNTWREQPRYPLKVFLDASIIIAAALSGRGTARALLDLIALDVCDGVVSSFVLDEARRNLALKAPLGSPVLDEVLAEVGLRLVNPTSEQVEVVERFVEVKDAPVVAAALAAGVDALVTFDKKHLLNREREIGEALGIAVVDPGAILRRVMGE